MISLAQHIARYMYMYICDTYFTDIPNTFVSTNKSVALLAQVLIEQLVKSKQLLICIH